MIVKIEIAITFAWWWPLYRAALVFFCQLMGTEPNEAKLEKVMRAAMRTRAVASSP